MSCNKAGYLTARHNEVRNLIGALAKEVTSEVANDPVIRKGVAATDDRSAIPELKADLLIQGFWENDSEKVVCIDFCVHDTDAASSSREVRTALSRKEASKRLKYFLECSKRGMSFSPFAMAAAEGSLGPAAMIILNRLSKLLAAKWNRKVASIRSWIQTRIAFAVMRGTSLCLRGSRQSWRKLGLYDYGWEGVRGQFL